MTIALLNSIEWHDLPVTTLAISERGIELVVALWIEPIGEYAQCALRIDEPEKLHLDMNGALSAVDLRGLEVSTFNYTVSKTDRLSGKIGILPNGAGFWTISFVNADWSFEEV